jgi:hypothetical protein
MAKQKYPDLEWMYHIPNGGSRNKKEAHNLSLQGVKPGVPDIFLPVARGSFHGLYIEMKSDGGKVSDNQDKWLGALFGNGYYTTVSYNWESAKNIILNYLKLR